MREQHIHLLIFVLVAVGRLQFVEDVVQIGRLLAVELRHSSLDVWVAARFLSAFYYT